MSIVRSVMNLNVRLSQWFDRIFMPVDYLKDGNQDFIKEFAPGYLRSGQKIYDVGGGKQPFVSLDRKAAGHLTVVGIDISAPELAKAPAGAYDESVCADIAEYRGRGDGDIVICQAVLEHVQNTEGAMKSIASILKPGGRALIFVPSRNAVFARLNLALPQTLKQKILFAIYPSTRAAQGFPSYYHRCTPNDMLAMAKANDMTLETGRYYYISSYFSFMFPVYLVWRIWMLLFRTAAGHQAAETFSFALIKQPQEQAA